MIYTLDTNILIYYSKGDTHIMDFMVKNFEKKDALILPTVVAIEFLSYPALTDGEREIFISLFSQFLTVSLDTAIALLAADLKRNYQMKLGDSVIAATAIITQSSLATRNVRDFRKIKELNICVL